MTRERSEDPSVELWNQDEPGRGQREILRKELRPQIEKEVRADLWNQKAREASPDHSDLMIDPNHAYHDPKTAAGDLEESQWELFERRYRPLEDKTLKELTRGFETGFAEEARSAGKSARRGLNAVKGSTRRSLGRRGVTMTQDQAQAAKHARGLNRARTIGTAENLARRDARDQSLKGLGDALSIAKGVSGSASENLGAAADLASNRDKTHKAAKQQHRQSMISTGLTAAALLI